MEEDRLGLDRDQYITCSACGVVMRKAAKGRGKGLPAKRCTCGAVYCPDCFDALPGIFGEELGAIVMVFTPIAAVGYYLAAIGPKLPQVFIVLAVSIGIGIGLNLSVVAPLSRILRLAKQCPACGGRTCADWSSIPLEAPPGEDERDRASQG